MNYKKIFWGYLFLFDFRIEGFDILPDVIGFILIVLGLSSLIGINDNYRTARSFAIPLIFLSVFDIYQAPTQETFTIFSTSGIFGLVIAVAISILSILMARGLLMGIKEEAHSLGMDDIAEKARNRWHLYLAVALMLIVSLLIPPFAALLIVPLMILSVLSYILILMLLRKTETEIWAYRNHPDTEAHGI